MRLWEKILLGLLTFAASFRGVIFLVFGWGRMPVPDWPLLDREPMATLIRVDGSCLSVFLTVFALLILIPYYLLSLVEVRGMSGAAKWLWAGLILFGSVIAMPIFYFILISRGSRPPPSGEGEER